MSRFVRRVDARNFHLEHNFFIIVARRWRDTVVFVDTEFLDAIYSSTKPHYGLSPAEHYALLKANIQEIQPIQVGITICYISRLSITWEFNLCDFDISSHPHDQESVTLLQSSGINLSHVRRWGLPSSWLVSLLINSGLIGLRSEAKWVVFQGGYDVAILMNALWKLRGPMVAEPILPVTLGGFMAQARWIFGGGIYDVKCLMWVCGLHGGLELLAKQLMVKRQVGRPHQAGSDCLFICHVFFRMVALYLNFKDGRHGQHLPYRGLLYDLKY